jgi:hypothetical protein
VGTYSHYRDDPSNICIIINLAADGALTALGFVPGLNIVGVGGALKFTYDAASAIGNMVNPDPLGNRDYEYYKVNVKYIDEVHWDGNVTRTNYNYDVYYIWNDDRKTAPYWHQHNVYDYSTVDILYGVN